MTLVLLHPIGLDGGCWQFMTSSRLGAATRYDLLWHGGRDEPSGRFGIDAMAEDVLDRVDGDLDLVGVSMGAAVARHVAARCPQRVRSLMLAAFAVKPNPKVAAERAEAVEREGMEGIVTSTLSRWFSATALRSSTHPGVEYACKTLRRGSSASFAASWRALGEIAGQRLDLPPVPITVLHPADDANGRLEDKEELVRSLPLARLVVVPGPHLVVLDEPKVFEAAILDHLDWVGVHA